MEEEKGSSRAEPIDESAPPPADNNESATQSTQARKPARKRTKTGCLTCRRRRIKCGEERPICQNCIKSKRECEGYTQRVIPRHPLSMFSNPSLFPRGPPGSTPLRMPADSPYLGSLSQSQLSGQQQNSLLPLAPRPVEFAGPMPGAYNATYNGNTAFPRGVSGSLSGPTQGEDATSGPELAVPASSHQPSLRRESTLPSNPTYTPDGFYQGRIINTVDQLNQSGAQSTPSHIQDRNVGEGYTTPGQPQGVDCCPPQAQHYSLHSAEGQYVANRELIEPALDDDYEMDDYYDVESDEELAMERSNNFQTILAISSQGDQRPRSFSTYLNEPNILTTYRPSPFMSPLMNSTCARIFCHFAGSTAPLLSIFERHPINPSALFTGAPVPLSQQGLWTYTLPMMALGHQGLLHAILAIASLHIARLQQSSVITSHKHYHFALRRVAKALGLPQRRRQTETLAATLLLAFYEVISAEHSKWNSHVSGAAQLLREIDFVGITRDLRAKRARVNAERQRSDQTDLWWVSSTGAVSDDDPFAEKEGSVDETFISTLMGKAIRYDEYGTVESEELPQPKRPLTAKDIEEFRIQSDLYWWYCKQDLVQSMISGNPLLMSYDRWGQCPPRAGAGRLDAVYGTMDHLFLLLARLCNFGAVDRDRKLKVMEANGGQYIPPPSLFQPPPSNEGPDPKLSGSSVNQPHGNTQMPSGASENRSPGSNISGDADNTPIDGTDPSTGPGRQPRNAGNPTVSDTLEAETAEAKAEWTRILAAFEAFSEALGPGFAPLPSDSVPSIATPFGPAVQYRTHTVSFLVAFYYTGMILLHRLHPDMPAAAMIAAGLAAPRTGKYSQLIGKIAAGLYYPQRPGLPGGGLSPTLGAALSDITITLFFAGVQFRDAAQRGWTISKLRDIARLTGWQSAATIAAGCETAWVKTFEAGRGPPYQRTMDAWSPDSRISGKPMPERQDLEGRAVLSEVENDRRYVAVDQSARVHWATGILSIENDFKKLEVGRNGDPLHEPER